MFKKILFATTASPICEEAARVAFGLAQKYGARIKMIHVYGLPSHGFSTHVTVFNSHEEIEVDADYEVGLREALWASHAPLLEKISDPELVVTAGVPPTEILREARRWGSDLIVMGAHTRVSEPEALKYRNISGNTLQKVAKSATSPLLVVGHAAAPPSLSFKHIIFGTDLSKASDAAFGFALKIAVITGATLSIFHVMERQEGGAGNPGEAESVEERLMAMREKIKARYLSRAGGCDAIDVAVWEGTAHTALLNFSRERKGDLIVVSCHGTSMDIVDEGTSTVEQLVLGASCPVVSVRG